MTTPGGIDAYLATLPADKAHCLQTLREKIVVLLPTSEEVMSYAMPGHRIGKSVIAGYAGFKNNCGFYPHSGRIIPQFADELAGLGFKTSKGGMLFTPDKPIPDDLLARIVAARLNEAGLG